MKLSDYQKLVDCRFISYYGMRVERYWSSEDRHRYHNLKDIEVELMKQLECDFDYKNCVILFPLATGYGETALFNNREIVIDHCTYILDIADFLKSKGVKWEDGSEFKVDQCFPRLPVLIVKNGRAKMKEIFNPLLEKRAIGDMEMFFSGFLVHKLRKNNLIRNNFLA